MEGGHSQTNATTVILDKPFLKIARTKNNVHDGKLTMEFGDRLVQFNTPN